MMKRRDFTRLAARVAFGATFSLMLGGCASDTLVASPVPEVGFQHLKPIRLNVARIDVGSTYQSPMAPPNAEHRFPTSPAKAMTNWAKQRLHSGGEPGTGKIGRAHV